MTPTIEMKPLSQKKRRLVFLLSLLLFVLAVPFSVFYAIGYRFDFSKELTSITSVGGMYVRNDTDNTQMYINDEPVRDMRVFQRAAYIQNLKAGMHRLHVQGEQVQTWVKNLPVYPHFVTEVTPFNMPKVPRVRIITQWTDPQSGNGVVFEAATSTQFDFASVTNTLQFSASTATSTLDANPEYAYVQSLFASSTEAHELLIAQEETARRNAFTFGPVATTSTLTATTTKNWREYSLYEKGEDVFISWNGDINSIPYYYCVMYHGKKESSREYGKHVYESIERQLSPDADLDDLIGHRVCRREIRIDRIGQQVEWFGFFPDSADLILMHLDDGLYVVEVDDRAWQNTQLLYPGTRIQVVQDGGRIYIKDGDYYLEVFTQSTPQA